MTFNKSLFAGLLLSSVLLLSFSSCKKCVVPEEDASTGVIVENAIVYTTSGYFQSDMYGNYLVNGNSDFADKFLVSFDGGATKQNVNWSTYNIVGYPTDVNCKASFVRDVSINSVMQFATYTITGETCVDCEQMRRVENWVLIPALPAGYLMYYDVDIVEK